MSIPVLTQVYDEVRRLSIAGSVVAAGDFRLKKLVPPLEQAGQKAPVFAKVAQAVDRLVASSEKTSADALLELSTLVNAILYTQGETGRAGEFAAIESVDLGQRETQASARVLKPLLEALSTTGGGRMEIIKDAHQRGAFRDLRLVAPSLAAIDDSYPEIGDFIAEHVLPLYGRAIYPGLRDKLDIKGRAGHVRRLLLMHRLDPVASRETVKRALDEGSKEIKVAAIECLGSAPEDLSFILEQCRTKAKDVRTAAFRALGKCDADEATQALCAALQGADIALAVAPAQASRNPRVLAFVLDRARADLTALLASREKDKAKLGAQVQRMLLILDCLHGRDDDGTGKFLLDAFDHREKLAAVKGEPGGKDLVERLVSMMAWGPEQVQAALVEAHTTLSADELSEAFFVACRSRKPTEVYSLFSPYLTANVDEKKKKRDLAYVKRETIATALSEHWRWRPKDEDDDSLGDSRRDLASKLDPRWLDLAVKMQHLELVLALALPGHAGANRLLSMAYEQQLKASKHPNDMGPILWAMVRVQHPAATDAVLVEIDKHARSTHIDVIPIIAKFIPDLPKTAVPRFEALLPTLPEKVIDQVLEYVTQLKNRE
jgi:hypothetical protein